MKEFEKTIGEVEDVREFVNMHEPNMRSSFAFMATYSCMQFYLEHPSICNGIDLSSISKDNHCDPYRIRAEYWMLKSINDLKIPNGWKYGILNFPNTDDILKIAIAGYLTDNEDEAYNPINPDHFDHNEIAEPDRDVEDVFKIYQLFEHDLIIDDTDKHFIPAKKLYDAIKKLYEELTSEDYEPTLTEDNLDKFMYLLTEHSVILRTNTISIKNLVWAVYHYTLSKFKSALTLIYSCGEVRELQSSILKSIVKVMDLELQKYEVYLGDLVDLLQFKKYSSGIEEIGVRNKSDKMRDFERKCGDLCIAVSSACILSIHGSKIVEDIVDKRIERYNKSFIRYNY